MKITLIFILILLALTSTLHQRNYGARASGITGHDEMSNARKIPGMTLRTKNGFPLAVFLRRNKEYSFVRTHRVLFEEAMDSCFNLNATVLSIDSLEEHDYIASILTSLGGQEDDHDMWVFAFKQGRNWKWGVTGKKVEQRSWGEGEPTEGTADEGPCVILTAQGTTWRMSNADCTLDPVGYICARTLC